MQVPQEDERGTDSEGALVERASPEAALGAISKLEKFPHPDTEGNERHKRRMTIAASGEGEDLSYTPFNTPISPHSSMQAVSEDVDIEGDESRENTIKGEQIEESPFTQLQEGGPEPAPAALEIAVLNVICPATIRFLGQITTVIALTIILTIILFIAIRQEHYVIDYPPFPISKFTGNTSTISPFEVEQPPQVNITSRKSWRSLLNDMFERLGEEMAGSLEEM